MIGQSNKPLPGGRVGGRMGVVTPDSPALMQGPASSYLFPNLKDIAGPTDPLLGPSEPDDIAGLVEGNNKLLNVLTKMLIAQRAMHPNCTIPVDGPQTLAANSGDFYKFNIGGKPVPALALFLQNNSPNSVYVGLEDPPSPTNFALAAGAQLYLPQVTLAFISLFSVAGLTVTGVTHRGQPQSPPVNNLQTLYMVAWSNGEWTNIWGMAS